MRVVHFSKKAKFQLRPIEIKNDPEHGPWNKPRGGLWASPLAAGFSWEDWCQDETFGDSSSQLKVILEIDTRNFIIIRNEADLNKLPWFHVVPEIKLEAIDFEKLVTDGVNGIYLTEQGQWNTRFSYPRALFGWGCESVLILNERCIGQIEEVTGEYPGTVRPSSDLS